MSFEMSRCLHAVYSFSPLLIARKHNVDSSRCIVDCCFFSTPMKEEICTTSRLSDSVMNRLDQGI